MYSNDIWSLLVDLVNRHKIKIRLRVFSEFSEWSDWIQLPDKNYVEIAQWGPVEIKDIEQLELTLFEEKYLGKHIPSRKVDHADSIKKVFADNEISFSVDENTLNINFPMSSH